MEGLKGTYHVLWMIGTDIQTRQPRPGVVVPERWHETIEALGAVVNEMYEVRILREYEEATPEIKLQLIGEKFLLAIDKALKVRQVLKSLDLTAFQNQSQHFAPNVVLEYVDRIELLCRELKYVLYIFGFAENCREINVGSAIFALYATAEIRYKEVIALHEG